MTRLNDLTDINLTGIPGGLTTNWEKFVLSNFNISENIKITSSDTSFNPSAYNPTTDGRTYTVAAGLDAGETYTRFSQLSIASVTPKGFPLLGSTDLNLGNNATTQSIKKITSAVCTTVGTYYFGFRRNSTTTNQSYSTGGTHDWPTLGIISDVGGLPSLSVTDLIVDESSNEYKLALLQGQGGVTARGNTVCIGENGSEIVIVVMPLNSTSQYKLLTSSDGGATWTLSNAGSLNTSGAEYTNVVYARDAFYACYITGTYNYNFIKSTDGGATWTSVSSLNGESYYYSEFEYFAGTFLLVSTYFPYYKRSSDLLTWSGEVEYSTDTTEQNALFVSEGTGILYASGAGNTQFTKNLQANYSGKPGQSRGWSDNTKNKRKTNSGTNPQLFYHSGKLDGTFYRAWYNLDIVTAQGGANPTVYVNTEIADVVPEIPGYTERFSSWDPVSQAAVQSFKYDQTYSFQNQFSSEVVSHGVFVRLSDENQSYASFYSSDALNWARVADTGVTSNFLLWEPNETNASWGVVNPSGFGSFYVGATGLSGSFTQATLPSTTQMVTNGITGHIAGAGDNWLVTAKYRANNIRTIIYSTDGGATFSVLSGVPTDNTDRPWAVAYVNGYWVYWRRNGSTGDGIYYSTDLVNWTHNTSVPVGDVVTLECWYINGRYTFTNSSGGGSIRSNTDITATSGWVQSAFPGPTGFTSSTMVSLTDQTTWIDVSVRDTTAFNGTVPTNIVNPTDSIIDDIGQGYQAFNSNYVDNGLSEYTRPIYLNGYWYVITLNGMIFRNSNTRLI